jgi:ribonuclease HII
MEIDRDGILPATRAAMQRAIAALRPRPRHLLVDAVDLRAVVALPQQRMHHGEHASLSIAAASIIAKVARDELMKALDSHYPEYGFAKHKGYGTRAHQRALHTHGAAPVHRHSFRPVAALAAA